MATESILTISPKSSPYPSQISTRPVSPNPSSIGFYPSSVHQDNPSYSHEKLQLRKLNDQFLSYIERVRIFETYNHCLTLHCEQIRNAQSRTKTKLDHLQEEFDEYQQDKCEREKKDLQLESKNLHQNEEQVNSLKNKQSFCQYEHEAHRKQIIDLQKQSIDLQGKTDVLRFEYENLNDDHNHYRKQLSYYQLFKSSIIDEITHQRDIHQRLQIELDDLKMQQQISIQAHEADAQAIEIQNDNILYDLTNSFRFDGHGKNVLTQMLNEIREEYKIKDHDMRDELHRKYLYEYNQHVKKQVDQNIFGINREEIERRHLTNEMNSLDDNRLLLRQKVALVQEHYKQLEMNFQREMKRQKEMEEKYQHQIKDLRVSVQEYENLLSNKSLLRQPTLENEVNKYRQLLEGSDHQIGLRQLINISSKIDRIAPIHRPTTPPPSSMQKSDSASTLLVRPSLTRENSFSENSYETALISQSSANTTTNNQPFLTLDSANEKLFHSDYDTDNDQSQTIQYMSGRSSRLMSENEATPTILTPVDRESLPPLPTTESINHDETIVEISIDTSHTEGLINQTLPFIPMNIVTTVGIEENKDRVSDGQQSPIISTLEKREEVDHQNIEPISLSLIETIIPITIDVDPKTVANTTDTKIILPSTPTISPIPITDQAVTESTVVEVPVSTVKMTNPLAKLISTMLPNVIPFVPTSNGTTNRPVSPVPIATSTMNNDAMPFIPNQPPHGSNQHHLNNTNAGHWNSGGTRGGGGNRRGQNGGGGFHHGGGSGGGGGGNQRSAGGGNWQQGGGHQKGRRGGK